MSWQQISPGRHEREFSLMERFYRGIAASGAPIQKDPYTVSSGIQLSTAPSASALQKALIGLRHQHPQIALVADEGISRYVYEVPSKEDLDAWVKKTLIVHDEDCSADSLHSTLLPSSLFMIHFIPSTRQLLFRTPHWRTDGIGLLHLQDAFLSILAEGAEADSHFDGSEFARMVPPLDEVAKLPKDITTEMDQSSNSELAVLATGATPISIPTQPSTTPKNTIRTGISLPRELSQKLISACKARDITVTTAVQAALILLSRTHGEPQDGRFVCFNTVNVRKYLPEPWSGVPGAFGVYHTGLTCSIDLGKSQDFNAVVADLQKNYHRDIPQGFTYMVDYVQKIGVMLSAPIELAIQAPAHPELSSLGILDDYLQTKYSGPGGTFEVQDWWIGIQVVNRILQTYLFTRDGQMNLHAGFNESFYEKEWVEKFLQDWRDLLIKELLG